MNQRKKHEKKYLKGLLFRIILTCLLFLLFYFGTKFTVSIYGYDAQKVIETIQNNDLVDQAKEKILTKF